MSVGTELDIKKLGQSQISTSTWHKLPSKINFDKAS